MTKDERYIHAILHLKEAIFALDKAQKALGRLDRDGTLQSVIGSLTNFVLNLGGRFS